MTRRPLATYRRITVKIGSALLVDRNTGLKRDWLRSLVDDIAALIDAGAEILVVSLGAIALGRTAFGVGLVVAYGVGMATTLTTVGFLVARIPGRMTRLRTRVAGTRLGPLVAAGPAVTAVIVLVVGLALAVRSAAPLV